MLELDAVQTLALAGLTAFLGYALCRRVPLFARYNLPAPVVGGLVVALVVLAAHLQGTTLLVLDTGLQAPLMIAFFTAIGFNASFSLLRASGGQVLLLLAIATVFAVLQNLLGILVASSFGLHPLFGVVAGSTTLTGGPATGLAFAPLFEQAGVAGAESVAVASAMAGIICGGVLGGPMVTRLIRRHRLQSSHAPSADSPAEPDAAGTEASSGAREMNALKAMVMILLAMWLGSWISRGISALDVTLPAYVGAMVVGALLRNLDDQTGWLRLPMEAIAVIGSVCLVLFLCVALMNLRLWELSGLAFPLLVNLALQVLLVALLFGLVFRMMGRDYDAAVTTGGFIGFILGTTANAMAVMQTLVERYGAAPRAYLVAPIVGAFFIDFTNALVITGFINFWA